MAELPTRVRALLEEAREGDGPNASDRARVRASLMAAIAAGKAPMGGEGSAEAGSSPSGAATSAGTSGALVKWGGVLLAGAVATAAWVAQPWRETGESEARAGAVTEAEAATEGVTGTEGGTGTEAITRTEALTGAEVTGTGAEVAGAEAETGAKAETRAETGTETDTSSRVEAEAEAATGTGPAAVTGAEGEGATGSVGGRRAKPPRRGGAARRAKGAAGGGDDAARTAAAPASTVTASEDASCEDTDTPERAPEDTAPSAVPAASTGRQELALIQAATRALSDGELIHAMHMIDDHAARFPHGVLAQEREGLRVLTLCKLGRIAEGLRAQARFLEREPGSPLAARVRAACGGEDAP